MENPQSILITGASSGLGWALSLYYAQEGRTLFLMGRDASRLSEIATHCVAQGAIVYSHHCDVTNKTEMLNWIAKQDQRTPIDLVIANAGISAGTGGGIESAKQAEAIFNVNLNGVLHTLHPLIEPMMNRERGQIAVVSSLAGFRGMKTAPAYAASKAAIRSYAEGLRGELAQYNIGVTCICPGFIDTPLTRVNQFPMPFLMQADKAARIIGQRLVRNPPRIAFPWIMYIVTLWFSMLPLCVTDYVMRWLPNKVASSN